MVDSDHEYNKKRRDKFQGERSDSYRSDKRKDEHGEMDTQPPIMTFKAFLQSQDDNITDKEAIAKYAEYKLEFRRQQLNEFFVAHKEEEWFKLKYHPEETLKRKDEPDSALEKRADVFIEMLDSGRRDEIKVDTEQDDAVVKLLDNVVIRLEEGTDLDLTILDQQDGGASSSETTPGSESSYLQEDDIVRGTKKLRVKKKEETPAPPPPRTQNPQAPSTSGATERPDRPQASVLTQEDPNEIRDPDEICDGFRWVQEAILMLLSTYSKLQGNRESGKISAKKMWDQISLELTAHGHNIKAGQCKSKFKSLKKRYKSVIDHNKTSGNDRKTWPYFQIMDEMFSPWVNPVRVLESSEAISASSSPCPSPSPRASCSSTSAKRPCKRARNDDDAFVEELKASREQRERMHAEYMELQTRLLREIRRMNAMEEEHVNQK